MSLSELREKDVVNVDTGKKLGKVMDIEFCVSTGCVQAIVQGRAQRRCDPLGAHRAHRGRRDIGSAAARRYSGGLMQ